MFKSIFGKTFKFTVVMPIYNTKQYLAESIDSIINQTIGFEENIQLILVNDGSNDGSEEICRAYEEKYPQNVKYVYQENSGVSVARNVGLKLAKGQFLNFFDSDDIWELDAFEKAWNMFNQYEKEIDVVTCKQFFFEGKEGGHKLNDKFKAGDRVIDIKEEPRALLFAVTPTFIRTSVAKKYDFDHRIKLGEDSKYITQVILEKEKIGLLGSSSYHIRKRMIGTSLTQNVEKNSFMATIQFFYDWVLEESIKRYGKVIPYIQYLVLYPLKFRVISSSYDIGDLWNRIVEIIGSLDDEVIATVNQTVMSTKVHLLRLKHPGMSFNDFSIEGTRLTYEGYLIGNMAIKRIAIDTVEDGFIRGRIMVPFFEDVKLFALANGERIEAKVMIQKELDKVASNGDVIIPGRTFEVKVSGEAIQFELQIEGKRIRQKTIITT